MVKAEYLTALLGRVESQPWRASCSDPTVIISSPRKVGPYAPVCLLQFCLLNTLGVAPATAPPGTLTTCLPSKITSLLLCCHPCECSIYIYKFSLSSLSLSQIKDSDVSNSSVPGPSIPRPHVVKSELKHSSLEGE